MTIRYVGETGPRSIAILFARIDSLDPRARVSVVPCVSSIKASRSLSREPSLIQIPTRRVGGRAEVRDPILMYTQTKVNKSDAHVKNNTNHSYNLPLLGNARSAGRVLPNSVRDWFILYMFYGDHCIIIVTFYFTPKFIDTATDWFNFIPTRHLPSTSDSADYP